MSDRPIEPGDRFESQDTRDEGRVIKVLETVVDRVDGTDEAAETERVYRVQVQVHPDNPDAVGHEYTIGETTLRNTTHYRRVSR